MSELLSQEVSGETTIEKTTQLPRSLLGKIEYHEKHFTISPPRESFMTQVANIAIRLENLESVGFELHSVSRYENVRPLSEIMGMRMPAYGVRRYDFGFLKVTRPVWLTKLAEDNLNLCLSRDNSDFNMFMTRAFAKYEAIWRVQEQFNEVIRIFDKDKQIYTGTQKLHSPAPWPIPYMPVDLQKIETRPPVR